MKPPTLVGDVYSARRPRPKRARNPPVRPVKEPSAVDQSCLTMSTEMPTKVLPITRIKKSLTVMRAKPNNVVISSQAARTLSQSGRTNDSVVESTKSEDQQKPLKVLKIKKLPISSIMKGGKVQGSAAIVQLSMAAPQIQQFTTTQMKKITGSSGGSGRKLLIKRKEP